jgi:hypothetical protein
MEWTADVSAGDWLRERIDDPWRATMHDVVPRGFAAYARVFHPASRDRPVGEPWPGLPYARHQKNWDAFQDRNPEIVDERVTWAATAVAMGTTMHPLAQWHALVAPGRIVENEDGPRDAAGWRYTDPETGGMPPDVLAALAAVLAAHTAEPADGHVALWEGFGGLVGHMGTSPSRVFFQLGDGGPELDHHNEMLSRTLKDPFNNVFRKETWQEGILSRDISDGPRFELPGRDHVLFRCGVAELARPDWVLHVPWRDRLAEEHGFDPAAQSPSLIWPADRGSSDLIAALLAEPQLEAFEIPEGARLTWDSDEVNR